jgi:hypothetical protein
MGSSRQASSGCRLDGWSGPGLSPLICYWNVLIKRSAVTGGFVAGASGN